MPDWSPDGKWLAYDSQESGSSQIYVVGSNGTGRKRLTTGGNQVAPTWSPDGQWIAFLSDRDLGTALFEPLNRRMDWAVTP